MTRHLLPTLAFLAALPAFVGCAEADAPPEPVAAEDAIIGGSRIDASVYPAVGALMTLDTTGAATQGCTATLIAPRLALTAKHCVVSPRVPTGPTVLDAGGRLELRMGTDWEKATRTLAVDRVFLCAVSTGGFPNFGCDMAVVRLAEAVTDIAPIPVHVAPLGEDQIHKQFVGVGYGVSDAAGRLNGKKKAGTMTLQALDGAPFHAIYPRYEDFAATLDAAEGAGFAAKNEAQNRRRYDVRLLPEYELFAGGAKGDAQGCEGDSGGPLLTKGAGKLEVFGVASASLPGQLHLCESVGMAFATFGPEARRMLAEANADVLE